MSIQDLIDYIIDTYTVDDVLYMIGKDERWLYEKIIEELLEYKEELIQGDEYYTEIN